MPADPRAVLPEVDAYRGSFGRYCALAAEALDKGLSRDAVRVAMQGYGENIHLGELRAAFSARVGLYSDAKDALQGAGMSEADATKLLIRMARDTRAAVEGEFGIEHRGEWCPLSLPLVSPHP